MDYDSRPLYFLNFTYQYILLLLQLVVSSVKPAVVSLFLEHNRIQCAAMPRTLPHWGMSAQICASTFDQIFKYLKGYAISQLINNKEM